MLGRIFGSLFDFFKNLLGAMLEGIAKLFHTLFTNLFEFLMLILKPFLIVIAILFYFIYKLAELVFALLTVLLAIGKLFYALVKGIFVTIAGFNFTPTTTPPDHGAWTSYFVHIFAAFEYFQMDNVGYIIMFMIWLFTAFAAIKIMSKKGA